MSRMFSLLSVAVAAHALASLSGCYVSGDYHHYRGHRPHRVVHHDVHCDYPPPRHHRKAHHGHYDRGHGGHHADRGHHGGGHRDGHGGQRGRR